MFSHALTLYQQALIQHARRAHRAFVSVANDIKGNAPSTSTEMLLLHESKTNNCMKGLLPVTVLNWTYSHRSFFLLSLG